VPTQDKENLEDAVRKQHDLIEKQSEELKSLRSKLEEQDKELNAARWGGGQNCSCCAYDLLMIC